MSGKALERGSGRRAWWMVLSTETDLFFYLSVLVLEKVVWCINLLQLSFAALFWRRFYFLIYILESFWVGVSIKFAKVQFHRFFLLYRRSCKQLTWLNGDIYFLMLNHYWSVWLWIRIQSGYVLFYNGTFMLPLWIIAMYSEQTTRFYFESDMGRTNTHLSAHLFSFLSLL